MNKIANSTKTLDELLRVLIRAWGFETVLCHLRNLENAELPRSHNKTRHRRSASDYIEPMELPAEQKNILRELANRFESRVFLPTIGDIRYFLERNKGVSLNSIRSRAAAIPHVFDILRTLPAENLTDILQDGNYAGPSRLGPLSDAIRAHTVRNMNRPSKE
jgi:hypothetical protein